MYRIYKAMADRISDYMTGRGTLTADAMLGSSRLEVDDASIFNKEAVNNSFPTLLLTDNNSTGKKGGTAYGGSVLAGTELIYIERIHANSIILQSPLEKSWLVSDSSEVLRAPAGIPVRKVIMGDISVSGQYPMISVIPVSKAISWRTLNSTMDKVVIDFVVYTKDIDTEEATLSVLKLADALEWILISNLHIKPEGYTRTFEVTSIAMPKNVQYGTIAKGSEFLKAATITWEADLWFYRSYLTAQGMTDDAMGALGTLDNFGPLNAT